MNAYSANHQYDSLFFRFHVGGSDGSPLAQKINNLSHIEGALSSQQIQQLVYQFPTIMIQGYSANECFAISSQQLESVLEAILERVPMLTPSHKTLARDASWHIAAVNNTSFVSQCASNIATEKAKTLALEIFNLLR